MKLITVSTLTALLFLSSCAGKIAKNDSSREPNQVTGDVNSAETATKENFKCSFQVMARYSNKNKAFDLDQNNNVIILGEKNFEKKVVGTYSAKKYKIELLAKKSDIGTSLQFNAIDESLEKIILSAVGVFSSSQKKMKLQAYIPEATMNLFCDRL